MAETKERLEYDVILVGAGPSNLSLAHRLVDLAKTKPDMKLTIAVLDKAEQFGGHTVSGAVVNPSIIDKVFPNYVEDNMPIEAVCKESALSIMSPHHKWDMPSVMTRALAPGFFKEGYLILTLSLVVRWMAETLETKAKELDNVKVDMFPGFPVNEILFEGEGEEMRVAGVKVGRSGDPVEDNLYGKVVSFGEKGFVSKDIIKKFDLEKNPQLWSVGVKETWKLADDAPDIEGKVWHTAGYPTMDGTLGGGFIYGLKNKRVTFGLVISLDSHNPNIHPQKQLQEYKKHPFFQDLLKGGEIMHYGAAVLPEGGLPSFPKKFQVNGALMLGDALGTLDVMSLAGVDKAMESGYVAAKTIFDAFASGKVGETVTEEQLSSYQENLMASPYMDIMKKNKYFRKAFLENENLLGDYLIDVVDSVEKFENPIPGGLSIGMKDPVGSIKSTLRLNKLLNSAKEVHEDVIYQAGYKNINPDFSKDLINRGHVVEDYDKKTLYSREDVVFYAHTKYNEHPHHIDEFNAETCLKCIKTYESKGLDVPCVSDCTAEVHRLDTSGEGVKVHGMSLENCVMCRTCELICPEQNLRVNAAYAASGPDCAGL